jgi:hypothetical protein
MRVKSDGITQISPLQMLERDWAGVKRGFGVGSRESEVGSHESALMSRVCGVIAVSPFVTGVTSQNSSPLPTPLDFRLLTPGFGMIGRIATAPPRIVATTLARGLVVRLLSVWFAV